MTKDAAKPGAEPYAQVVARLQKLVEALEGGELSLEDALEKFGEGVNLVKRAEVLLSDAEKRVEQLMSDDKVVPLDAPAAAAPVPVPAAVAIKPAAASRKAPAVEDDTDVPF